MHAYTPAQLTRYFSHIGLKEQDARGLNPRGQLACLTVLQRHHMARVPFESLSLHYSRTRLLSLEPDDLYSKIIEKGRGGYCMEVSAFFASVLRGTGFTLFSAGARVKGPAGYKATFSKYTYGDDAVPSEPGLLVAHGVKHPTRSSLNLTSLPDEFLKIWHPTFLIRHPAMMLPSLYRTTLADLGPDAERLKARQGKGPLKHEATMKWIRTLYEFFAAYLPKDSMWPIVLDADDIMKTPELVTKYAPLADLDPAKLRFSWEMVPNEKIKTISKAHQVMTSSIRASSKTDTSKAAGAIDIDTENTKWRAEFGEEGCRNLEQWVRDMMPDYLAMHSKRLRLN